MKLPQILVTTLVATSMVVIEAACSDEPSLEDSSLGASTTTIAAATAATGVKETASSKLAPTTNGAVQRIHLSIPDLVERVRPSVVHIATERFRSDSFGRAVPSSGTGTGFIISEDGHIVTNNHVVEGAAHIVVTYAEGAVADAEIVGLDPQTDLAVLRIDVDGLTPVPLGNSSDLRVGDTVVAVGHALDLMGSPTVTAGVVSAQDRVLTGIGPQQLTLSDLIQTDASINPGNSGGPLLNLFSEVVGVNSAGAGDADGIGFAIAIDNAELVIESLIQDGVVTRGFMGISSTTITPSLARQRTLPVDAGLLIRSVTLDSGAARGGLSPNDIIVAVNDEEVGDLGKLGRLLAQYGPGSTVEVWFLRPETGDERQRTDVTLGERPDR
jgi:S1-C subfamily serine protease